MKHVKKYDAKLNDIQVGEYVLLCIYNINFHKDYYNFLANNIGQIIDIDYFYVKIKYDNIPDNIIHNFKNNCIKTDVVHICVHSFDKEKIEALFSTKKYNL